MKYNHRRLISLTALFSVISLLIIHSSVEASTIRLDRGNDVYLMEYWNGSSWANMNAREYYVVGTSPQQIAYCIEHTKTGPAGEDYPAANAWSAYANQSQIAMQSILGNGYPFTRSFTVSGTTYTLSDIQARYATAQALRFWMGQRKYYHYAWDDISQWSDAQLRSLAASGTIPGKVRARSGQIRTLQMAVELYINARNGNTNLSHTVSFSPASLTFTEVNGQLRAATVVTVQNASLGYRLVNVPSEVSVLGYTGRSGDTLTFTAPPTLATSLSSFTLTAEAYDDRVVLANYTLLREPAPQNQRMIFVRTVAPFSSSAYTTTRLAATRNLTINVPTDLSVTSVTAGTYEPGSTMQITAVVRNISQRASGSYQLRITGPSGYTTRTVSQSSLAAGAQRSYTFTYTAPVNLYQTTPIFTVTVDPNNNLSEATRTNNTGSVTATIRAIRDIEVVSIQTDQSTYLPGEIVQVSALVRNNSTRASGPFHVRLSSGNATLSETAWSSMGGNSTRTYNYSFAAPQVAGTTSYPLTLLADSRHVLTELTKSNNSKSTSLTIVGLPDLEIIDSTIQDYFTDKEVVISALIRNSGGAAVPDVQVRLTFADQDIIESIPVPASGSNRVVFRVRTPTQPGSYPVTIEVDPEQKVDESDISNNTLTRQISVADENRIPMPDPDWPVLEQTFIAGAKQLPDLIVPAGSARHTWQEIRLENGSFVSRSFWVQLDTEFSVIPDPRVAISGKPRLIESGFGLKAAADTVLTTNYDYPEKLVGPQMVYLFYPETNFGRQPFNGFADALIHTTGIAGDHLTSWAYPPSPFSLLGSRLHFTPLWIPDGPYPILAQTFYAWSPLGQLFEYQADSVQILGSMYDRVTVVRR